MRMYVCLSVCVCVSLPAYKKLVMKYHPDKNLDKSKDEREKAEAMFRDVSDAYDILTDPGRASQFEHLKLSHERHWCTLLFGVCAPHLSVFAAPHNLSLSCIDPFNVFVTDKRRRYDRGEDLEDQGGGGGHPGGFHFRQGFGGGGFGRGGFQFSFG